MIVPPQNSLRVFLTAAKRGEGRLNGWAQDKADGLREKSFKGEICIWDSLVTTWTMTMTTTPGTMRA